MIGLLLSELKAHNSHLVLNRTFNPKKNKRIIKNKVLNSPRMNMIPSILCNIFPNSFQFIYQFLNSLNKNRFQLMIEFQSFILQLFPLFFSSNSISVSSSSSSEKSPSLSLSLPFSSSSIISSSLSPSTTVLLSELMLESAA